MKILYNNSEIKNGVFLTPLESRMKPKVEYNAKPNTLYTLIMHDPDAVVGNWLHWVIVNIKGNNVKNGDELFEYTYPAPPKGSGMHRYIFLLYEQPERIQTQLTNRMITMDNFYKKLNIKLEPISSVYFKSKNQDGGKNKKKNKTKRIINKKRYAKTRKMKSNTS